MSRGLNMITIKFFIGSFLSACAISTDSVAHPPAPPPVLKKVNNKFIDLEKYEWSIEDLGENGESLHIWAIDMSEENTERHIELDLQLQEFGLANLYFENRKDDVSDLHQTAVDLHSVMNEENFPPHKNDHFHAVRRGMPHHMPEILFENAIKRKTDAHVCVTSERLEPGDFSIESDGEDVKLTPPAVGKINELFGRELLDPKRENWKTTFHENNWKTISHEVWTKERLESALESAKEISFHSYMWRFLQRKCNDDGSALRDDIKIDESLQFVAGDFNFVGRGENTDVVLLSEGLKKLHQLFTDEFDEKIPGVDDSFSWIISKMDGEDCSDFFATDDSDIGFVNKLNSAKKVTLSANKDVKVRFLKPLPEKINIDDFDVYRNGKAIIRPNAFKKINAIAEARDVQRSGKDSPGLFHDGYEYQLMGIKHSVVGESIDREQSIKLSPLDESMDREQLIKLLEDCDTMEFMIRSPYFSFGEKVTDYFRKHSKAGQCPVHYKEFFPGAFYVSVQSNGDASELKKDPIFKGNNILESAQNHVKHFEEDADAVVDCFKKLIPEAPEKTIVSDVQILGPNDIVFQKGFAMESGNDAADVMLDPNGEDLLGWERFRHERSNQGGSKMLFNKFEITTNIDGNIDAVEQEDDGKAAAESKAKISGQIHQDPGVITLVDGFGNSGFQVAYGVGEVRNIPVSDFLQGKIGTFLKHDVHRNRLMILPHLSAEWADVFGAFVDDEQIVSFYSKLKLAYKISVDEVNQKIQDFVSSFKGDFVEVKVPKMVWVNYNNHRPGCKILNIGMQGVEFFEKYKKHYVATVHQVHAIGSVRYSAALHVPGPHVLN